MTPRMTVPLTPALIGTSPSAHPAVVANDRISLTVLPGEIHAVLGEQTAPASRR